MGTSPPVVLIVEDEEAVARSYERTLEEQYEVRVALDGERGLERLDESVDVVLLDRMMPGMSGSAVLERIEQRPVSPRIVVVTAVDPDFDIIEMSFDDYITKPPARDELQETVAELCDRADMATRVREYRSLLQTRATLEAEKSTEELEDSEEFTQLCADIQTLEDELEADHESLVDDATFAGELRRLAGDEGDS
jgi:DNA-binding response OmpR family regulator